MKRNSSVKCHHLHPRCGNASFSLCLSYLSSLVKDRYPNQLKPGYLGNLLWSQHSDFRHLKEVWVCDRDRQNCAAKWQMRCLFHSKNYAFCVCLIMRQLLFSQFIWPELSPSLSLSHAHTTFLCWIYISIKFSIHYLTDWIISTLFWLLPLSKAVSLYLNSSLP